jgi:hypothetical protein
MDSIDDELPTDLARLRNEIATGLYAQLPIRHESIEQEDVLGVAHALVIRLVQAYRFEWIRPPEPERDTEWTLDGFSWTPGEPAPSRWSPSSR